MVKHRVAQVCRLFVESGKVLQHIYPFVIQRVKLVQVLVEFSYFHILKPQLLVEHLVGFLVNQRHIMADRVSCKSLFVHVKVEQSHHVDVCQLKVPVLSLWSLFAYGKGRIIQ